MNKTYFTIKVATEKAFCNRAQESQTLINNIKKNQHTVIVAPRRYGKTSLAINNLTQLQQPFVRIDLFCVVYEEDVCRKVAKGISVLIRNMMSLSEKTLNFLQQCFKSAFIAFNAGQLELKVEFGRAMADPISQLEDLLEGLEVLANKQNKPVILFLDEFQDVLKVDGTNKIQAAIRAVAQHSKYVTYIFSGSSRMMLNKIFDDKNQPLYMLCHKIMLDRIAPEHFKKHIQEAAQHRWGKPLSDEVSNTIITLTESHPYYVNLLCDKVWESNKLPTVKDILACWEAALAENKGKVISDLEPLNSNRIKVMTTVALLGIVKEPSSKAFLDELKLPLSTTQNSIKYLIDNDYLATSKEGIQVLDPLVRKFIIEQYQ